MNYKELTVFNFKISYYVFRIFTIFWLGQQVLFFLKFSKRPKEFYEPTILIQKIFMPEYPSSTLYFSVIFFTLVLLLYSFLRFSLWVNVLLFFLTAYVSLVVVGYKGVGHHNHLLVLSFFFSVFLNPKEMNYKDFRAVEIYYSGILITYSLAGFWKLVSVAKDFITQNPEISWFERDAAKYNTMLNYFMIDQKVPVLMFQFYQYKELWLLLTIGAIICQASCILGVFNRKTLTFTLIFLVVFHFYTAYFVIADWRIMKYGLILLFFPYHHFSAWISKTFKV